MKKLLISLVISVFLLLGSNAVVLAQNESSVNDLINTPNSFITFRCSDFLNALPQGFVRDTNKGWGGTENSYSCEFYNPDEVPSGSELDVDIIPGRVSIRGAKNASQQYEQRKNRELANKYGYKIIAEDTVGEKSYVGFAYLGGVGQHKGDSVRGVKTVFYKGPCLVDVFYLSKFNAAVLDYHPPIKYGGVQNLHPDFDHGHKRMQVEAERIAGNIAGICTNNKIIVQDNKMTVRDTVIPASKTEEERYNECVDKCFLDKILSMCPDNNSMNQCTFDLADARKECLRTCKPPVQFRTPKASDQERIITQQDYGDQKVIILNGLPITNSPSANSPFVSYSPVIDKIDFILAKTNKPQKVSDKNLEIWVADMKGDAQIYLATGSAQPQWSAAKIGDILPEGIKIFVAKDASLLIGTDVGVLKVTGLSNLTITKATLTDEGGKKRITLYIDLSIGKIEADMDKGQYELDMQINTLSSVAKVKGTPFFVNFDDEKMLAETGVFGGEVEVESLVTGQKLVLVPQSDSKPRIALVPLEVSVPTPTQEPVSSVTQEAQAPQKSGNGFTPMLILLTAGGIGLYILHKKGKLKSLYEKYKISEMIRRISKIGREEKK